MKTHVRVLLEDSFKYSLGHIPSALSILPIVKNLYESKTDNPIVIGKSFGLQAWFIDKAVRDYYSEHQQYKILTTDFFKCSRFNVVYTQEQLGLAAGFAVGYSIANDTPTICILSDGDCFLASTMSAIDTAIKFNAKVHFVVDHNNVQLFSNRSAQHLQYYNIEHCSQYDPNNYNSSETKVLLVDTIKGFGCKPLEETSKDWHYRKIADESELKYLLSNIS